VREDVLGILKSLDHFKICGFHCAVQRIRTPLTLFVDVSDNLSL
jgi:hypothetical protein